MDTRTEHGLTGAVHVGKITSSLLLFDILLFIHPGIPLALFVKALYRVLMLRQLSVMTPRLLSESEQTENGVFFL